MAMIQCKECDKAVSTHALVCPNCGAPFPDLSESERRQAAKLSAIARSGKFGGLIFLMGALWVASIALSGASPEVLIYTWGTAKWMLIGGGLWYLVAEIERNLEVRKAKKWLKKTK